MKTNLLTITIIILSACVYGQKQSNTTDYQQIFIKFKTDIIGEWQQTKYSPSTIIEDGFEVDTIQEKKLPFNPHDNKMIIFEQNGYFKTKNSHSKKHFEIINFDDFTHMIRIRLDGIDYSAIIEDSLLSLSHHSTHYGWTVELKRK